jgi:hypothetical protein
MTIDVRPDQSGFGCFHCGGHRHVRFIRIAAQAPVRDPDHELTRQGRVTVLRLCSVCLGAIVSRSSFTVVAGVEPTKCGTCGAPLEVAGGCADCGQCADCQCLPDCVADSIRKEV